MALSLSNALSDEDLMSLVERIKKLRPVVLDDLPMSDLLKYLSQRWTPDTQRILEAGSATIDLLGDVKRGNAEVTWPGASSISNVVDIAHGFDSNPSQFFVQTTDSTVIGPNTAVITGIGTPTIPVVVCTTDAGEPVAASVTPLCWMAIR